MAGDRQSVPMRLIDQRKELRALNALGLEAADALGPPLVDFLADLFRRFSRVLPAGPRGAEVRARTVNARADLLASLDAPPRAHHALGIDLARRKRRRDAVAQENQRI